MKSGWPADRIERWPIDRLIPYVRNARTHSDEQVAQLAASLTEWGWTTPVLVDEAGVLIAGHGRVLAARKLGYGEIPVMVAAGWSDAKKRAYALADNRLPLNAGWDADLLAVELDELRDLKFDMSLMGFGQQELNDLIGTPNTGFDPDEVPPMPVVPVSRTGDLWLLGPKHRLLCGDSTKPEDVARLMGGAKADLCFTSPPYAKQRDYAGNLGDWDTLMQGVFAALPMADGAQVLVNLGLVHRDCEWWPYWEPWIEWMRGQGWRRFGWYCWDQGPGLPGDWNGRLAPAFEFVFHFNKEAERARKTKKKLAASVQYNDHGNGMRRKDGTMSGVSSPEKSLQLNKVPDSVIRVMRHKARGIETEHPAVFPVALAEEIIAAFSDPGDVCYEPLSGSGSQILAAERIDRKCYAMEQTAAYVDVTLQRWAIVTSKQATLDGDGRTFEEVKRERIEITA